MHPSQQAENLPGRLAIMNLPQDQSPRSANHGDDESSAIERILELCRCHQELIGYEIHDGFVQRATAALLHLQAYLALDDEGHTGQRRDAIEMAADLLTQSVEEARSFIGGVRSPMLQEGGLVPAIRRLVSEIRISGGPDIEFCPDVEFGRLEPPLEYAAFRIIQECLRNAHRHSQSSKVEVRLSRHTSRLRIERNLLSAR